MKKHYPSLELLSTITNTLRALITNSPKPHHYLFLSPFIFPGKNKVGQYGSGVFINTSFSRTSPASTLSRATRRMQRMPS